MDASSENSAGTVPPDARPDWRRRLRLHGGWLIYGTLLLLVLIGLCVTLCSQSRQLIQPDLSRTVPRKIVPLPQSQSEWRSPARVTALLPPPQTAGQTLLTLRPRADAIEMAATTREPFVSSRTASPQNVPHVPLQTADVRPSFNRPVIAIVIDDMGLDRRRSAQIAALPAPVTLAYMPYAPQVARQTADARANGHELIVHMPMEPDDLAHNNPGPDALLLKNGVSENVRRLDKNLAAFDGYIGINNHMGSALTANRAAITPVLHDLQARGLWFLDSKTDARSVASRVAAEIGLPFAARDVFLDNVNDRNAVLKQLAVTEEIARRKGYAIAIGHPKDGTVAALRDWGKEVTQRGFTLVSLSTIIAARFPQAHVPRYARLSNDTKISQR